MPTMKPDPEYVRQRDALIPEAAAFADRKCGSRFVGQPYRSEEGFRAAWNRAFHGEIERLCRERIWGREE